MKQTIGNACGTIALLHAVANNRQSLNLGGLAEEEEGCGLQMWSCRLQP
jgi:hypothetical protein